MFSLVIPVYKNEESLPELLQTLDELSASLASPLQVVFVVDGSPDGSYQYLKENLTGKGFCSKLCQHSRNFGSFAAIRSGLALADGPYFAVMAADLQEPVSLIRSFFELLASGEAEVTIGTREERDDPSTSAVASKIFWWTYRKLVFPDIPPGGVDVFGCNLACRDQVLRLQESNSSLVGLLFWIGFRRSRVPYVRQKRRHGHSAWTFSRKVRYLLDSLYSFSDLPIRTLKWVGSLAMVLAALVGGVVLAARLTGRIGVPGYTPIVLTVIFFGGLNAFGLGVIGEYVWRAFENTKRRPLAIVQSTESFNARQQ